MIECGVEVRRIVTDDWALAFCRKHGYVDRETGDSDHAAIADCEVVLAKRLPRHRP